MYLSGGTVQYIVACWYRVRSRNKYDWRFKGVTGFQVDVKSTLNLVQMQYLLV